MIILDKSGSSKDKSKKAGSHPGFFCMLSLNHVPLILEPLTLDP